MMNPQPPCDDDLPDWGGPCTPPSPDDGGDDGEQSTSSTRATSEAGSASGDLAEWLCTPPSPVPDDGGNDGEHATASDGESQAFWDELARAGPPPPVPNDLAPDTPGDETRAFWDGLKQEAATNARKRKCRKEAGILLDLAGKLVEREAAARESLANITLCDPSQPTKNNVRSIFFLAARRRKTLVALLLCGLDFASASRT